MNRLVGEYKEDFFEVKNISKNFPQKEANRTKLLKAF